MKHTMRKFRHNLCLKALLKGRDGFVAEVIHGGGLHYGEVEGLAAAER